MQEVSMKNSSHPISPDEDAFSDIECCVCLELIDDSKNDSMIVSYVYNQYAHIRCYWQDRLDKFIPKESLQDLLIKMEDASDMIDLFGLIIESFDRIIPPDMQKQVVSEYNKRFVEYCNKMRDLKQEKKNEKVINNVKLNYYEE